MAFFQGGANNEIITGNDAENDHLLGGGGNDIIQGLGGADQLNGEDGDDQIYGGAGSDTINGGFGNDTIDGGTGFDLLQGWFGNDLINGGTGDDTLEGGDGGDILQGEAGFDILRGGAGGDQLYGGENGDALYGGAGDDILNSGASTTGTDYVEGNDGADIFQIFNTPAGTTGGPFDTWIGDFTPGVDRIDISQVPGSTGTNAQFFADSFWLANDSVRVVLPNGTTFSLVGISLQDAQANFQFWVL